MTLIAHLSFAAGVLHLALGGYVLRLQASARAARVFAWLCGSFAVWSLAFAFFVAAPTREAAWFWYRVSAVGWCLGPPVLLHFFHALARPGWLAGRCWVLALIYLPGVLFFVAALRGAVYAHDLVLTPYGWDEVIAPLPVVTWLYILFYVAYSASGLILVYRWGKHTAIPHQRVQARIILWSALPTVLIASISNVGLRLLDVHHLPGLATLVFPVWTLSMGHAVVRYGLFQLTPAVAARDILETMSDALLLLGKEWTVGVANRAARELLGAGCVGQRLAAALGPEAQLTEAALEERLRAGSVQDMECGWRDRRLLCSAATVTDAFGDHAGVVLILRDVTERHQLEEQLRQAVKLQAVGQLAAGVAHDFNNLLASILAYVELLAVESPAGSVGQEASEAIGQAARQAAELTRQLLGFARQGKHQQVAVDLHEAIITITEILERTLSRQITLVRRLEARRSTVVGDPDQLRQVLVNLALNARDAMSEGGTLTLATAATTLEPGMALAADLPAGAYLQVEVSDTGRGISPEDQPRVFEPFFTTKEPGKGAGLGLATVWGIVRNHGGAVSLASTPGAGTVVTLLLPTATVELPVPVAGPAALPLSRGDILLVDDEPLVRAALKRWLTRTGCTVLTAENGREAVSLFRDHPGKIDLVLLDMIMPEMGGQECFHRLRELDPAVRVLICSGYAKDGRVQELLEAGALGFLQKPFEVEAVLRVLREGKAPREE